MTNPLNSLLRPPRPDGPHYRWGYVTSVSPTLQVVLDTETDPIQKPSTLVDLAPGDRVFVLMESLRSTVLGRANAPELPVEVRRGSLVIPAVGANSGGGGGAVTFTPPFASDSNIFISVMLPSARLTWAQNGITASGFTLSIDNHSDGNSATGTAYWKAERYA